jgi:hypothetical protein
MLRRGSAQNITPANFQAERPGPEFRAGKGRGLCLGRGGAAKGWLRIGATGMRRRGQPPLGSAFF